MNKCPAWPIISSTRRRAIVGGWIEDAEKMTPEELLESLPNAWADDVTGMAKSWIPLFPNVCRNE